MSEPLLGLQLGVVPQRRVATLGFSDRQRLTGDFFLNRALLLCHSYDFVLISLRVEGGALTPSDSANFPHAHTESDYHRRSASGSSVGSLGCPFCLPLSASLFMATFEDQITIERPRPIVFDFLTTSVNIERVSAADMGLTFLDAPDKYHQGAVVKFQIMGLGQLQTATHEVTEFDAPHRFSEQMIEGAMKHWVHEHIFEDDGDSTHVIDRITFEPPGGLLGFIATEDRILESLENGFFSRNRTTKKLLEEDVDV